MRIVAVEPTRATVELSMEELGLLMNALWQELGYQAPRRRALEEDLRAKLRRPPGGPAGPDLGACVGDGNQRNWLPLTPRNGADVARLSPLVPRNRL
jgi:hypothetical protein